MTEQEGAAIRWRGEPPRLHEPVMVAAFVGWPDAGEVASRALRHLIEHLPARKVAEIDPEEFYVFTETRPNTLILAPGQRALEWPANEFFSWRNPSGQRDIVILQNHLNGISLLSSNVLALADLNDDGYLTAADVDPLRRSR